MIRYLYRGNVKSGHMAVGEMKENQVEDGCQTLVQRQGSGSMEVISRHTADENNSFLWNGFANGE